MKLPQKIESMHQFLSLFAGFVLVAAAPKYPLLDRTSSENGYLFFGITGFIIEMATFILKILKVLNKMPFYIAICINRLARGVYIIYCVLVCKLMFCYDK